MSELKDLKTSDPTNFKELMTAEAKKLQAAADEAGTSTSEGKALSSLAQKFTDVANGGDMSQLMPPPPPQGPPPGTYNQSGQVSKDLSTTTQSTSSSSGKSIKDIMDSVFSDLEQAMQS